MFDSNCIGDISRPVNTTHDKVRPMREEVFFELLEEKNHKGLILPTGYRQTNDTVHGLIITIGDDVDDVKVGDHIIASKQHSYQFDFIDKKIFKVYKGNILAVVE
jgi:co-chaperonin GroES (HSP10)